MATIRCEIDVYREGHHCYMSRPLLITDPSDLSHKIVTGCEVRNQSPTPMSVQKRVYTDGVLTSTTDLVLAMGDSVQSPTLVANGTYDSIPFLVPEVAPANYSEELVKRWKITGFSYKNQWVVTGTMWDSHTEGTNKPPVPKHRGPDRFHP